MLSNTFPGLSIKAKQNQSSVFSWRWRQALMKVTLQHHLWKSTSWSHSPDRPFSLCRCDTVEHCAGPRMKDKLWQVFLPLVRCWSGAFPQCRKHRDRGTGRGWSTLPAPAVPATAPSLSSPTSDVSGTMAGGLRRANKEQWSRPKGVLLFKTHWEDICNAVLAGQHI